MREVDTVMSGSYLAKYKANTFAQSLVNCKVSRHDARMRNSAKCRSHCPINFVLETFGDKWTLLIVRDLMFKGKRTYAEFLQSPEGISSNILVERLKRLEKHGIVVRQPAEDKRSTLYRLTAKGKDLLPVMLELTAWSAKHDSLTNTPTQFSTALRKGRSELMESILSKLE